MPSLNKFNAFVKNLGDKKINLGTDQLKIALCAAANAPVAGNSVLADLTEITYTNLSTRNITTTSWAQAAGIAKLLLVNLILTASGGAVAPFRYVVVFDDTAANKELIGWADIGSIITLADTDSEEIKFDQVNGALTLQ